MDSIGVHLFPNWSLQSNALPHNVLELCVVQGIQFVSSSVFFYIPLINNGCVVMFAVYDDIGKYSHSDLDSDLVM